MPNEKTDPMIDRFFPLNNFFNSNINPLPKRLTVSVIWSDSVCSAEEEIIAVTTKATIPTQNNTSIEAIEIIK